MLLCDTGSEWSSPRVWQASQHIVETYRPQWEQLHLRLTASSPQHVPQLLRRRQQQQRQGQRHRVWRVLFQTRRSAVRQFVNLQQLLSECAAWSHLDAATGTLHTAECSIWDSHPLPEGIAGALPRRAVLCHGLLRAAMKL